MSSTPASSSPAGVANPFKSDVPADLSYFPLPDWKVFEITGPDAEHFLQSRLSNDVTALQVGQSQLNAALTRQGKIQGVFSLLKTAEDTYWLLAPADEATRAIEGIHQFHILESFTTRECPHQCLFLQGTNGLEKGFTLWNQPPANDGQVMLPHTHFETRLHEHPVRILNRSLSLAEGYILMAASGNDLERRLQETIGPPLSRAAFEAGRVEAGIPRYGQDYSDQTLLPETGLEHQTVSYDKGCYLGQEVVARVRTYGALQKKLIGLVFGGATCPPVDIPCLVHGEPIGHLSSVVFSSRFHAPIALAWLNKDWQIPGRTLTIDIGGQSYEARISALPFN